MQLQMIDAAVEAGVERFLANSVSILQFRAIDKRKFTWGRLLSRISWKRSLINTLVLHTRLLPSVCHVPSPPDLTDLWPGNFAEFPFLVPAMFDLDFERWNACIIGDGEAPISFTSFAE